MAASPSTAQNTPWQRTREPAASPNAHRPAFMAPQTSQAHLPASFTSLFTHHTPPSPASQPPCMDCKNTLKSTLTILHTRDIIPLRLPRGSVLPSGTGTASWEKTGGARTLRFPSSQTCPSPRAWSRAAPLSEEAGTRGRPWAKSMCWCCFCSLPPRAEVTWHLATAPRRRPPTTCPHSSPSRLLRGGSSRQLQVTGWLVILTE